MSKKNKVILALLAVAAVLFCVLQFVILPPKLAAQDAFHQNHAITHDIACPFCRKAYGNTNGPNQEREGARLVREFLQDTGMPQAQVERVAYLVGHHHTLAQIDGIDYQILIEADYLANASENGYAKEIIQRFLDRFCKTASGAQLLRAAFCLA